MARAVARIANMRQQATKRIIVKGAKQNARAAARIALRATKQPHRETASYRKIDREGGENERSSW